MGPQPRGQEMPPVRDAGPADNPSPVKRWDVERRDGTTETFAGTDCWSDGAGAVRITDDEGLVAVFPLDTVSCVRRDGVSTEDVADFDWADLFHRFVEDVGAAAEARDGFVPNQWLSPAERAEVVAYAGPEWTDTFFGRAS